MRLDISGQFVVNVVTPNGGWSKGRPVAFIEDGDTWHIVVEASNRETIAALGEVRVQTLAARPRRPRPLARAELARIADR